MLHLDDLLIEHQETDPLLQYDSDAKETYAAELR